MRYTLFGKSGLRVSELGLGTMTFGDAALDYGPIQWGVGIDSATSLALLERFANAGGNLIDTAHYYTAGKSERCVGEFIRADRDHFVVSTKYTTTTSGDFAQAGNSRKTMMRSVEHSLRRLQTDYLDILWLHFWDRTTPLEEIMRGFEDLVRSGKVLYIGASDTPAWRVARANMLAELRGWTAFIGLQIEYSLLQRTPERDLLPMAQELGLGVGCFAALAGGVLSGKYLKPESQAGARLAATPPSARDLGVAQAVVDIACELGCTPSQVALAWVRQNRHFGSLVPILGVRSMAQLDDNLASLQVKLTSDQRERLDHLTIPERGFPHEMLESEVVQGLASANRIDLLTDLLGAKPSAV